MSNEEEIDHEAPIPSELIEEGEYQSLFDYEKEE